MNARVTNGQSGGTYINDTSAHTPNTVDLVWGAVQVIADTIFDNSTTCTILGLAASGDTIPAGTVLFGRWSNIKLTSGKVVAYNQH